MDKYRLSCPGSNPVLAALFALSQNLLWGSTSMALLREISLSQVLIVNVSLLKKYSGFSIFADKCLEQHNLGSFIF